MIRVAPPSAPDATILGVVTLRKSSWDMASLMRSTIMDLSSKMALTSGFLRSMNLLLRRVSISTLTLSITPRGRGVAALL